MNDENRIRFGTLCFYKGAKDDSFENLWFVTLYHRKTQRLQTFTKNIKNGLEPYIFAKVQKNE